MKIYYQTVSINRNSKSLKKTITDFLTQQWNWDEHDLKDGIKQTRYSLSFELYNNKLEELKNDVRDLTAFINDNRTSGKVYCSTIKCKIEEV